jgi:hypothetical protein
LLAHPSTGGGSRDGLREDLRGHKSLALTIILSPEVVVTIDLEFCAHFRSLVLFVYSAAKEVVPKGRAVYQLAFIVAHQERLAHEASDFVDIAIFRKNSWQMLNNTALYNVSVSL